MKSVISSKNYQDAEMELPLALGKTISNETYIVDLAKDAAFTYGRCYRSRKISWP